MFTGSALVNYNQVFWLIEFIPMHPKPNASSILTYISTNALGFAPAKDHVTSTTDLNIISKQWAPIPFFLGTNADEDRVFAAAAGLDQANLPITSAQVISTLLPNLSDAQNVTSKVYKDLVNDTYLFASQVITDIEFTCPTQSLSSFAASNGFDIWRYYCNASFPNESTFRESGAYHSSEIPQVWGMYGKYDGETTTQKGLSAYMQKTWADFAKDPSMGPAVGQGWQKLGSTGGTKELWQLGGPRVSEGGELIDLNTVNYGCVVCDPIVSFEGF